MDTPIQIRINISKIANQLTFLESQGHKPPDDELFRLKIQLVRLRKSLTMTELFVMHQNNEIDFATLLDDARYLYPYTWRDQLAALEITPDNHFSQR
jgi:hypothetical protein